MKIYDVVILGAGASGLMCASNISRKKLVAIVDSNDKVAKKLKISGGGKCNITNISVNVSNYDGDKELLKYVFKRFSQRKLLDFLERNRVALELRKDRYYFCKNSSQDIIDILMKDCLDKDFYLNHEVLELNKEKDIFSIKTDKRLLYAKQVVVATGGKSFSNLGASDIGLKIAKKFDIKVKEFEPALVGLTIQKEQFWMKELSGLSCFVNIKIGDKLINEEMLFTHKGISGPAVLSASLYWKKGDISIDFLPKDNISTYINGKKMLSSAIPLPKRLSQKLLEIIGVEDKECFKITKDEHLQLKKIHNYKFAPAGNYGFLKAEVCRGGICSDELDFKKLEAKKVKNLYFIGEVVDITGELGGYNFQWAFSSAYLCAKVLV